jgi:hypothetical protein
MWQRSNCVLQLNSGANDGTAIDVKNCASDVPADVSSQTTAWKLRFDVRNGRDARCMKLKSVLTVCCCGCGVAQLLCSEEKADGVANFVCFAAALHGTRLT